MAAQTLVTRCVGIRVVQAAGVMVDNRARQFSAGEEEAVREAGGRGRSVRNA